MKLRLLMVLLLAGCSTLPGAAPATPSPTPTAKAAAVSGPTHGVDVTPTAMVGPTALPASATPTPAPTAEMLQPVAVAAGARFDSWSPDSQWAAYWLSTAEDLAQTVGYAPPATLNVRNVNTGATCEHAQFVSHEYGSHLIWLPDGQFIALTNDPPQQGTPCRDDFVAIDPTAIPRPPTPDPSLSPGGDYQAVTTLVPDSSGLVSLSTTIVTTPTGQIMNTVRWSTFDGKGWQAALSPGGVWISDRLFLIGMTIDQGPLLIDVGSDVIQVVPELFGVPADPGWPAVFYMALAIPQPGADTFHLVLYSGGEAHRFPRVRLYHSETGQVEAMPFTHLWSPGLSPDGHWLLLDARPDREGYESYALWARPVDPAGSQSVFVGEGTSLWSPDWTQVAFGLKNRFSVVTFPGGDECQSGQVRVGYGLSPRAWAPDGRWVAYEGHTGQRQEAIFIIEAPGAG